MIAVLNNEPGADVVEKLLTPKETIAALLPGVLGHLLHAVEPAGAFSAWVPGAAGSAVTSLLDAGLRIEDFPALLCWDRPFADFSRYIPITLAIL